MRIIRVFLWIVGLPLRLGLALFALIIFGLICPENLSLLWKDVCLLVKGKIGGESAP